MRCARLSRVEDPPPRRFRYPTGLDMNRPPFTYGSDGNNAFALDTP